MAGQFETAEMDLEATKFFKGPRGSLLRAVALIFFLMASLMMISSLLTDRQVSHNSLQTAASLAALDMPIKQPARGL